MGKKLKTREYEAELIKVLDGDTIDCYIDLGFDLKVKKRIRYMGIDTWESRTRDLDEKKKVLQQKQETKNYSKRGSSNLYHLGQVNLVESLGKYLSHLNLSVNTLLNALTTPIVILIFHLMVGLVLMIFL